MPQKHPPASTTVSELLVLLSGSSVAGFGSFTAALDAWQAMVVRMIEIGSSRAIERIIMLLSFRVKAQIGLDRNAVCRTLFRQAHAFFLNVSEALFMQ
jgi:hypothetical protein